jgi:hypothetical protein
MHTYIHTHTHIHTYTHTHTQDVPDVRGDVVYAIPSFSVTMGAAKMFRIAWGLLFGLLSTASLATLSTAITSIASITSAGASVGASIGVASAASASMPLMPLMRFRLARGVLSAVLGGFAFDVRKNALLVEAGGAENPDNVFKFYMRVWNIFYGSYLLLPFYRL